MSDRGYANAGQVVGRQLRQHLGVDIILAQRGRVLFEPEAAQPFGHIHRSCPQTADLGNITTPA
jgi:hypothetical protein